MANPKSVFFLAAVACAACAGDVTAPQRATPAGTAVRRDGGTLGSGYRTSPADTTDAGSTTADAAVSGGTLGSGYAVPGGDNGTLGSGH